MSDADEAPRGIDGDDAPEDPHDHLRRDPALAPVVDRYGPLDLSPASDPFRRLVVSVCRQQVSSASARAIRERLFDRVEVTPAGVLAADSGAMREAGLSDRKVEYLRAIARRFRGREYDRSTFEAMTDEAVRAELTEVRGVGEWTADMFLVFGLGRPDVLPVGDLGVRRAVADLTDVPADDRAAIRDRADPWRPYRSYAALYLWHHYEDGDTDVGR